MNEDEFDRIIRERHQSFVKDLAEQTTTMAHRQLAAAHAQNIAETIPVQGDSQDRRQWTSRRQLHWLAAVAAAIAVTISINAVNLPRKDDEIWPPFNSSASSTAMSNSIQPTFDPTSMASIPPSFQRTVGGTEMSTLIPVDWPVSPCGAGNGCMQANNPRDASQFLRFGRIPATSRSLASIETDYERTFRSTRTGYRQLKFQVGTYHGCEAVQWEFEFDSDGIQRHARGLYWRANGNDYFIYASSTTAKWSGMAEIFQTMLAESAP
jgi:hypothetical protein